MANIVSRRGGRVFRGSQRRLTEWGALFEDPISPPYSLLPALSRQESSDAQTTGPNPRYYQDPAAPKLLQQPPDRTLQPNPLLVHASLNAAGLALRPFTIIRVRLLTMLAIAGLRLRPTRSRYLPCQGTTYLPTCQAPISRVPDKHETAALNPSCKPGLPSK